MLKSSVLLAVRNLLKHKAFSFVNVLGLAVGMAGCILMLLWIRHELQWDRFHTNLKNLYLVGTAHQHGSESQRGWGSPPALGPAMEAEYPEVARVSRYVSESVILEYEEQQVRESISLVDPQFLTMFSFAVLRGSAETALLDKHSIVLAESMATKYFGDDDPIGQIVTLDYRHPLRVTAVVADVPRNSTIRFDFLVPIQLSPELRQKPEWLDTWYNCAFETFVQLRPEADPRDLDRKIAGRVKQADPESIITPFLFPYRDLNLHSVSGEGSFIAVLATYSLIAVLILTIACVNFMNLSTAQAAGRAKEIGVRKVLGATRFELVVQFYCEALLYSFAALAVALVIVEHVLPAFNRLTGAEIGFGDLLDPWVAAGAIAVTVLTGLVAGGYPALVLSYLAPSRALRTKTTVGLRDTALRRVLVVFQFTSAVVLIACMFVIYRQFEFLSNKQPGYDKSNLVYFSLDRELWERYDVLKTALRSHPGVLHVTKSSSSPAGVYNNGSGWDWEGRDPGMDPMVSYLAVGTDWLETFDVPLVEGRFYSEGSADDHRDELIINETFAHMLGEDSAIGKRLRSADHDPEVREFTVIGVVRDFHFRPLWDDIGPLIVEFDRDRWRSYVFVRLSGDDIAATLMHIESTFKEFARDRLFEYAFVEEQLEGRYRYVKTRADLIRNFSAVAIFLSCLGLIGLASYVTERRSKEIAIRKVVGASVSRIVILLGKEFLWLLLFANLLGLSVAAIVMHRWLGSFPYRANLGPGSFIIASGITLATAMLVIGLRSFQCAAANPIEAIRNE